MVASESRRRARKTHEDRLIQVAVAMGELTMTVDPVTGQRYYARTQKPSPVFGTSEGPVTPPGKRAQRSARNRRRRRLLGPSGRVRPVVVGFLAIQLLGAVYHGPQILRSPELTKSQQTGIWIFP